MVYTVWVWSFYLYFGVATLQDETGKLRTEFNLAAWPGMVKFMELNISDFDFGIFEYAISEIVKIQIPMEYFC